MKKIGARGLLAGVLLASMATSITINAESLHERRLLIAIDDGSDDAQLFIDMDNRDTAVDLDDMQLGETRSLIDRNGRSVLVTRNAAGFQLNVDGKEIDIPNSSGGLGATGYDRHRDIHVDVTRDIRIEGAGNADSIMIISGDKIDDTTKDGIRSILSSSGHGGEVVFLDNYDSGAGRINETHDASDGMVHRRIKIISKETNETN